MAQSDTGTGMSPEFVKSGLFAPFVQAQRNTPDASGAGLGMSLVQSSAPPSLCKRKLIAGSRQATDEGLDRRQERARQGHECVDRTPCQADARSR